MDGECHDLNQVNSFKKIFLLQTDLTTGKSMKYSELLTNVDRLSAVLRRRGLKPNDVVLIMAANHIELPLFFFAVWNAGGSNACLTLNLLPGVSYNKFKPILFNYFVVNR
jgi:acyl-CoA synthetase (AMP-forming)/AMP-acid ligase II